MLRAHHHHHDPLPAFVRPVGAVLVCVGAWLRWWVVLDAPIDLGRIGLLLFAVGVAAVVAAVLVDGTWTAHRATDLTPHVPPELDGAAAPAIADEGG